MGLRSPQSSVSLSLVKHFEMFMSLFLPPSTFSFEMGPHVTNILCPLVDQNSSRSFEVLSNIGSRRERRLETPPERPENLRTRMGSTLFKIRDKSMLELRLYVHRRSRRRQLDPFLTRYPLY